MRSYHKHLITIVNGEPDTNYRITCSCGEAINVASLSDVFAVETALRHVKQALWDEEHADEN